jgi:hypothetical protein
MTHPQFSGLPDPDGIGSQVRYINDDPDDGERGRVVGWQDEDVALVMWPGNDFPMEERASDLVVIEGAKETESERDDDQETD